MSDDEQFSTNLFDTEAEAFNPAAPVADDEDDLQLDLTGDDLKQQKREPLPVGTWVQIVVYDASLGKVSKEGDNKGKPFYKLQFKPLPHEVDKHAGLTPKRIFFENMMLFSGAFFDAAKFLKALGYKTGDPRAQEIKVTVPHPSKLIGLELEAKVTKHEASNRHDDEGNPFMNEVFGAYRPLQEPSDGTIDDEAADLFTTGGANTNFG